MSSVQIRDVRKSFGSFEVLHGVSIPIDDGEFVVLVGPSGSAARALSAAIVRRSETQVFAKLGGEQFVAVFRQRHQFSPGDKVRLKPDPTLVHLFDETTGKRLNA